MSRPIDVAQHSEGRFSNDELLDHRNQPDSLPRSDRRASASHSQGLPSPGPLPGSSVGSAHPSSIPAVVRAQSGNMTARIRDDPAHFNQMSNEFAVEDDLQFGSLEDSTDLSGDMPKHGRNQSRPRAGSHLDVILSAPVRISPRVTYDARGRPPSLNLDTQIPAVLSRSSSTSSGQENARRQPLFSARARRMSTRAQDKDEERTSIDAPSHPDSQDGEDEEAEQDVCFPMSEDVHSAEGVDFDELDAFATEETTLQRSNTRSTRKMSYVSAHPDNILNEKESYITSSSSTGMSNADISSNHTQRDYSSRFASPAIAPLKTQQMYVPDILANEKVGPGPLLSKATSQPRPLTATHLRQMQRNSDAPDRFSFFTSERDDTLHAPNLSGLLSETNGSFKKLFRQDRGCWWMDVMCPTDSEMKTIAKAFGIHPLTAEDIRVQETREKVELFKSYYFVCFRSFDHDKDSEDFLEPVNIYIVVFKEGLLSFHFAPTSHPANVRRRIRQLRDYVSVSADWISYAIIDDVTDVFMPLIHEIENETDAIEDAVLITRENDEGDMLRRIGECRKKVMGLFRLLYGKADVIKMFAKRCNEQWDVAPKGEIGLYLGDIQDHLVTMTSSLTQFEKILSRSHSNYLAQLSIQSMESNNRLNSVLGKITLIATVLVPCNLICGLFGMNVPVPGRESASLAWFFGICGFMALFFIIVGLWSRKAKFA